MKEGRRVCGEGCGNATNLGYKLQRKQEEKRTSSKNWKKKKEEIKEEEESANVREAQGLN